MSFFRKKMHFFLHFYIFWSFSGTKVTPFCPQTTQKP